MVMAECRETCNKKELECNVSSRNLVAYMDLPNQQNKFSLHKCYYRVLSHVETYRYRTQRHTCDLASFPRFFLEGGGPLNEVDLKPASPLPGLSLINLQKKNTPVRLKFAQKNMKRFMAKARRIEY